MQREVVGVNASGEPMRIRQMPGMISVRNMWVVEGGGASFVDRGGGNGRAISGNAAKSALKAIPLASDRLLIFVLLSLFQVI